MEIKMRRFRQELPIEECKRILTDVKYAVLAVSGDEDYPYAVPVNYVYDGEMSVYIHSARDGHKLDSIRRNPKCSLCIVEKDDVVPTEFTSYFRSVIIFGKVSIVTDGKEIYKALRILCEKYSPGLDAVGEINKFFKEVCVVRIDIEAITGKEAIELVRQRNH